MKAIVATGDDRLVRIDEVDAPVAGAGELLVKVRATSVNRGELNRLIVSAPGWRPGWDFAGVVLSSSADGPPPGTQVFGMLSDAGSWAEVIAVTEGACAVIPPGLPPLTAAALPTAGLTALRLIRLGGPLAGRRVLVTGAAGGVGRLVIQLCRLAGAHVTAQAGSKERAAGLSELGACEIIVPGESPANCLYDVIFDSAGGASLRDSITSAAPYGLIISFGNSAQAASEFSVSEFYPKQLTLRGFHLLEDMKLRPPAHDLAELAVLVAAGTLSVDVETVYDWTAAATALASLGRRAIVGKAVLRVS